MSKVSAALAVSAAFATALLAPGPVASADAVYHSQHIALAPVAGAPLRSGFVENIHADGPRVYAMERYVLNGAAPSTTYAVTLQLFADRGCSAALGPFPSISFATNAVGDGVGHLRLVPADIPPAFHGLTIGVVWQLTDGAGLAYQTACSTVVLD